MPVEVYQGEIQKSETDGCQYRLIRLENGLQALLVHEPSCHKASAALDVHIGSFHDPENIPGLAHFLEHLLFMGTEKYPSENEYGRFLNEHGGSSNAFTASEHTNYFFDINSDHLEGALDRFAQFFISPLFLESSTEREMQAVDSEHSKNLLQDNWRLSQMEKSLSNPEHPYNKFGTGDLKTLGEGPKAEGIDIRETLIQFHKRWYSANIMSLVVLGKETLDELQAMVEPIFSLITNSNTPLPNWGTLPWTDAQRSTFINVKSIKDLRTLYLTWLCPDSKKDYLIKPQKFYSHLIGHEGHGSILALLKQKGWAISLSAGCDDDSTGYSFFEVSIELSSEGLAHYKEVIDIVFKHAELIDAKLGTPELDRCLEECKELSNINFRYRDREDPSNFSYKAARNLHRYHPKYALSGPFIQEQINMASIIDFGKAVNRNNVRVILATNGKGNNSSCFEWMKEKWYGTEYAVSPLKEHVVDFPTDELFLPDPNRFIPTKFDVLVKPAKPVPVKEPSLYMEEKHLRIWYKIDDTFETPKALVRILFRTDFIKESVEAAVAIHLFVEILKHLLTPTVYPAELAGLTYEIVVIQEGIDLKLSGFAEKLHLLLDTILRQLQSFDISQANFEILREQYQIQLANIEHEQPYWHCSYVTNGLLQQTNWWYWQRLEVVKKVTLEDVKKAGQSLLANCFVETLVHGSVDDPGRFARLINQHFKPSESSFVLSKALEVEKGRSVYCLPKPLDDPNSAVEVYVQTSFHSDVKNRALTSLFVQAFSEPFFDQLRTKEQLGYIVFCGRRDKYDQVGVRFVVQSTKGDPKFLEERILLFFRGLEDLLEAMTEDCFADIKTALIFKLRQKKLRLSQEASAFWEQIVPAHYEWPRAENDATFLETSINKPDLVSFVQEKFLAAPRILVVQAWPSTDCDDKTFIVSTSGGPPLSAKKITTPLGAE